MCNDMSFRVCNLFACPIFRIRPPIVLLFVFCFPVFRIQPPIALLFVFCFPVLRIQPPIALLFVFCFPVFRIVTQNPTTLSPLCQTSRPGTFYHNTIFRLNILEGLVAKLKHLWLCLPPIWSRSLIDVWLRMYGCSLETNPT